MNPPQLSSLSVINYIKAMDIAIKSQQLIIPPQHHQEDPSETERIKKFNLALGMPPWMTSEFIQDLSVEDFINIHTVILKGETVDEFLKK